MQMQSPPKGLFRRTPPAIFPPIFGLLGLGLAWRRAADGFAIPAAFGEAILGAVSLLFLFAIVAYLTKVIRRPGVVSEDLAVLPGRAGIAAMMLSGMLLAAVLVLYSAPLATLVLALALAGQVILVLLVLRSLRSGPAEVRVVTPVWHLVFVGFILSPLAALPLGWNGFSTVVFAVTLVLALAIWGVSLSQMARKEVPAPLRPTLAIHLAPASVLGSVAYMIGLPGLGFSLALLAILILAWLLIRLRWLIAAGFSPLWGAFTFPLAAFSTLMQIVAASGGSEAYRIAGGISLIAATLVIVPIAWKILQMWAKGGLAVKTNAASA